MSNDTNRIMGRDGYDKSVLRRTVDLPDADYIQKKFNETLDKELTLRSHDAYITRVYDTIKKIDEWLGGHELYHRNTISPSQIMLLGTTVTINYHERNECKVKWLNTMIEYIRKDTVMYNSRMIIWFDTYLRSRFMDNFGIASFFSYFICDISDDESQIALSRRMHACMKVIADTFMEKVHNKETE